MEHNRLHISPHAFLGKDRYRTKRIDIDYKKGGVFLLENVITILIILLLMLVILMKLLEKR